MSKHAVRKTASLWDPAILRPAVGDAFKKLDPRVMARNPVMFVVEVGCVLVTVIFVQIVVTLVAVGALARRRTGSTTNGQ